MSVIPGICTSLQSCICATTGLPQVISNSTGLLNEMLASETDPREGFVSELAEQCVRMKRCEV